MSDLSMYSIMLAAEVCLCSSFAALIMQIIIYVFIEWHTNGRYFMADSSITYA